MFWKCILDFSSFFKKPSHFNETSHFNFKYKIYTHNLLEWCHSNKYGAGCMTSAKTGKNLYCVIHIKNFEELASTIQRG